MASARSSEDKKASLSRLALLGMTLGACPRASSASRATSAGSIMFEVAGPDCGDDESSPGVRVVPGRTPSTSTPRSRISSHSDSARIRFHALVAA